LLKPSKHKTGSDIAVDILEYEVQPYGVLTDDSGSKTYYN